VAVGEESHWIPLTDLMTGLMVIFLLIAVSYMMQVEADAARIKNVAVAYSEIKDALVRGSQQGIQAGPAEVEGAAAQERSEPSVSRSPKCCLPRAAAS